MAIGKDFGIVWFELTTHMFMPCSTPYPKCLSYACGDEWVEYPWYATSEGVPKTRLCRPSQVKATAVPLATGSHSQMIRRHMGTIFNVILDEWYANMPIRVLLSKLV